MKVGVLALQGCIDSHIEIIKSLGAEAIKVTSPLELAQCTHLIMPGGESTTMLKLMHITELIDPLKDFIKLKPVWGICAGAILLSSTVENPSQFSFSGINLRAVRNFYGSQLDSFEAEIKIAFPGEQDYCIKAPFIRAPKLISLSEAAVPVAFLKNEPVGFVQDKVWAFAFHPELGTDVAIHKKFIEIL